MEISADTKVLEFLRDELTTKELPNRLYTRPVYAAPHPPRDPLAATLRLTTLSSVMDFCTANVDGFELPKYLLHVAGPNKVRLLSSIGGFHRDREEILSVQSQCDVQESLDRWVPLEEAKIAFLALLEETPDRELMKDLLSSVERTESTVVEEADLSQRVTAQAGVALKTKKKVDPIISIAPRLSFPEVQQVRADYLFRIRREDLHVLMREADGGAWRLEASRNVAEFLRAGLGDYAPKVLV